MDVDEDLSLQLFHLRIVITNPSILNVGTSFALRWTLERWRNGGPFITVNG
jgi:hypothetical protein